MDTGDYNTSNSRLWTKLKQAFSEEITQRYINMRANGYLTYENLISYYEDKVIATIGEKFFNLDQRLKYANDENKGFIYMCNGSRLEHTKRWLTERIKYMDSVFEYGDWMHSAVVRSNDILGEVTLRLKTYSPQHVAVTFSDQATGLIKRYCDKDKWYEFTGVIQNEKDNNMTIYGANNVMYIDGLDQLNVSNMLLNQATNLVEIDIHGSKNIQSLTLGDNKMLQTLNLKDCINLGSNAMLGTGINLEGCVNLKYLDLSNTQIGEVILNKNGGSLEYFDLSKTAITNLECNGQEYLPEIKLNECRNLSTVSISECNALTRLSLPNSKLASFKVTDCNSLDYLNISYTGYLEKLDLTGCESLTQLIMQGVSNAKLTEVDLRTLVNLTTLDISKCDFLNNVRFAKGFNKLISLNVQESGIKTFQFGIDPIPNYLDLSPFALQYVNFFNCTEVQHIKGLNLYATGSMSPFYNCMNLEKIEGSLNLTGSITRAFFGCENLTQLPDLNLSRVTGASEAFQSCKKLTFSQMRGILNKLTNCTDFYCTFRYCENIECTEYPSDLFANNKAMASLYWTFLGTKMSGQLGMGIFNNNTNLNTIRQPFPKISGYVPPNLFANNPKLTTCADLFAGQTELTIGGDSGMFANNPQLTHIYGLFDGCTNATMILDDNFFANNPKLNDCSYTFRNCKSIYGSLPANLLKGKEYLTNISQMFQGCSNITGEVPDNFLGGCTALNNISSLFNGCTGLTGRVKTNFWYDCQALVYASYVFNGCTGLGGDLTNMQEIPKDFFDKKYRLNDINGFFKDCNQLGFNLQSKWFKDCRQLAKVSELFYGCTNLSGTIPGDLFEILDEEGLPITTVFSEASAMLYGCTNLTGTIPENLFEKFLSVRNLSSFFHYCRNIEGEIPQRLFSRCYSVTNMSNMFRECTKLGRYPEDLTEEEPWALHPQLFASCANLLTISGMFYSWGHGGNIRGTLPPELFRTCVKLQDISQAFCNCDGLTGGLEAGLFRNNPALTNVRGAFQSCNGLNGDLSGTLFTDTANPKIINFTETFDGCGNLTGIAPALWSMFSNASRTNCFNGCTKLSNYDSIPNGWK